MGSTVSGWTARWSEPSTSIRLSVLPAQGHCNQLSHTHAAIPSLSMRTGIPAACEWQQSFLLLSSSCQAVCHKNEKSNYGRAGLMPQAGNSTTDLTWQPAVQMQVAMTMYDMTIMCLWNIKWISYLDLCPLVMMASMCILNIKNILKRTQTLKHLCF